MNILTYLLLGAVAGLLAGLLGIGGGLIIVPVLVITFRISGFSSHIETHMAVATSLATIVVTSLSSVREHHRYGAVRWSLFQYLAVGIVVGSFLGAKLAGRMTDPHLKAAIGIFAVLAGLKMALNVQPSTVAQLPGKTGLIAAGGIIGSISAVFGIGGGTLTVPFLTWCRVPVQQAVATSAACGFPIALVGALTNVQEGWQDPLLPAWSTGYLYWPAILGIVPTSLAFAILGSRLAHRLPAAGLKRIFSLLLLIVGSQFLIALWQ